MKKYVAAALMVGVAIGPASALDVGLGGNVGGLGVGAGVSAGSQGASVGVGASADGVGGANVGASVGTSNGSVGAGVSVGVGVTGIAGPGGGSPEKPVGTVAIAAISATATRSRVFRFMGERDVVKFQAAQSALDMVRRLLLETT